jgi:hypothetical protein
MRVFSPDFEYLYKISSFLRFQEVKKYTGTSILTLVIAASSDAAHYLQKNGWIVTDEPYVIKHIKQELEEITVTAYGGHQLLKQRVTAPATGQYAIEHTGSADAVVKHFINQSKRGLPLATAAVHGGVTISDQSRWKNLGDEVERVLVGAGRGEKYTFDADNKRIIFDTYLGVDRSIGNADDNPPVVFDLKYRNISEYTYTEDATVEQTTVYVGGQGEGVDREIIVTGNDATGIDRTEVFVDARDVEQGDTAKLTERATQATIPAAQTVSASAVADANLVYGADYNLGDIVTTNVPVKRYVKSSDYYDPVTETIQVNQRITEVVITREGGAEHIDLTFGDQPITQTQIQRLRAEIAQLKAVEPGLAAIHIESGVFTPTIGGDTTDGVISYTTQEGYYIKTGKKVSIWARLAIDVVTVAASGNLRIRGLPYASINRANMRISGTSIVSGVSWGESKTQASAFLGPNQTALLIYGTQSGYSPAVVSGDAVGNGDYFVISMEYPI